MASTNSQPRPPSRRTERSCSTCHRRKVRCDKQSPCSQCSQSGFSCFYPQGPVRRIRKTTITDVASRISRLEKTVAAVSRTQSHSQRSILPSHPTSKVAVDALHRSPGSDRTVSSHTTPTLPDAPVLNPIRAQASEPRASQRVDSERAEDSPGDEVLLRKGTSSQYINETLFSRVIEQEDDVRSALSTPGTSLQHPTTSPFNPMGILSGKRFDRSISSYLPLKPVAIRLWRVYVDRVDPCSKILHIPTDEVTIYTVIDNSENASAGALALCYAVCFSAVVALEPVEASVLLQEDKDVSLSRFKAGVEQAFAHSEFLEAPTLGLLQAFAIYLAALRVHNSGRGIWILNGLAIRAAESIGLHRDGKRLNLTPFESEIRRRLWWNLLARDGRAAEDHGFKATSGPSLATDVSVPLNLDDVDLHPGMTELPPPRAGWTRMTLGLTTFAIAQACGRLQENAADTKEEREAFRTQIFGEATEKMADILQLCNFIVPEQRMAIKVSRFMLRKVDLVCRQRESMSKSGYLATEENLLEAILTLEEAQDIWEDDLLRCFRWLTRSYPQLHIMLYILWHLCVRPHGPNTERALKAVECHFKATREADACPANESKWIVLNALRTKAVSIMNSTKEQGYRTGADSATSSSQPQAAEPTADFGAEWKHEMDMVREANFGDIDEMLDWRAILEDFQLDTIGL